MVEWSADTEKIKAHFLIMMNENAILRVENERIKKTYSDISS